MTDPVSAEGLGELLNRAIELADNRAKPDVSIVELPNGDLVPLVLGHQEGTTTQKVLDVDAIDPWLTRPLYRAGSPELTSLESFIAYTNRFKDGGSVVFANDTRDAPSIVAALDYHEGAEPGAQRHIRHTARFPVPLSDEWVGWMTCNGKNLQMPDFARFLEDHIVDVMNPGDVALSVDQAKFVNALGGIRRMADPAKLMELASGLQVFEESQVKQAHRIQTGESQVRIENAHKDGEGNDLIVPSMFVIAIPVFQSGEPYQIVVRLRYRKTGQGILFFYELWRADKVFDHAFNEACDKVASETSLPVYRGRK